MVQAVLTTDFVAAASCPAGKKKKDYFDLSQAGFMLEVRSSGGKTYYQRYTDQRGRERQFRIGPPNLLSLTTARRQGRTVQAQALVGDDPRLRRTALRSIPTLAELVKTRYLPHVKNYKRSWRTDETILRLHILPALGNHYVDQISSDHITALVRNMREKDYSSGTTNRAVIVLRHLFNLARQWRISGVSDNPTIGIELASDNNRERFLTMEETQRLIAAIERDENIIAARAILLLLLTGARRNEITFAKWEYFNPVKQTLLVPLSKSGKPRSIILNEAALQILNNMKNPGSGYIFPSPVTGRPSPSLHFPWLRMRKRAGLRDLRLHDLRHSFASFLVNRGVSLYVVQDLLGHSNSRYTQRYAHLAAETLQLASEAAANAVADAREYKQIEKSHTG